MKGEKLQKLLTLAEMLEQSALATTKTLRAEQQSVERDISDLLKTPENPTDVMDISFLTCQDHWFFWRKARLEELIDLRTEIEGKLKNARVVAMRSLGRRRAIEGTMEDIQLENKRLLERRATEGLGSPLKSTRTDKG